jgi:hypothetical protein
MAAFATAPDLSGWHRTKLGHKRYSARVALFMGPELLMGAAWWRRPDGPAAARRASAMASREWHCEVALGGACPTQRQVGDPHTKVLWCQ